MASLCAFRKITDRVAPGGVFVFSIRVYFFMIGYDKQQDSA
jgi:hypothetical protein